MQFTTTEIMGGLGNQLFQIFNLVAYCLRYKLPFYFSNEPIQAGHRKQTYWHTPLLQSLKPFVKIPHDWRPSPPAILQEHGFHYQPLQFYEQPHVKLFGYFQSYKYFQDQETNIFKLLQLNKTQAVVKKQTQNKYNYAQTIAVHFRVGDYVNLTKYHPLMSLEYYTEALTQFLRDQQQAQEEASAAGEQREQAEKDKIRSTALCETAEEAAKVCTLTDPYTVLYFCEKADQTYVETQLVHKLEANPIFKDKFKFQCIDHALADWEQLMVMSLCKYHIIANSTFSWWGAYLGASSQVYYPATWFGPGQGYKYMGDLFPPDWHQINI
jgi:hypothetical protein